MGIRILKNYKLVRVTVSANQVKVDYISSYLPKDEKTSQRNGQVAYTYALQK